ncbi:leucine-rich repeat-containing protein 74B-like [Chelonus insularis]|uniref:leucine-rich repeat-containing protein 74B-like n=1 Tax=Chelonus insularis TaxID=460826 RepID=UPI00158D7439|nr:leucine-rich repeat-containing protein 74B-like [Chelonus insularis]
MDKHQLSTSPEEYHEKIYQEIDKEFENNNHDSEDNYLFSIYSQNNSNKESDIFNYKTSNAYDDQLINSEFKNDDQKELLKLEKIKSYKSFETIINHSQSEFSTSDSSDLDSLICLAELKVSDSKLKIFNELYPIPEDPGLVKGFWILYPRPPEYNDDGLEKFINLTKTMKIKSIQRILPMFRTDELNLRYYNLDCRIMKVICEALLNNPFIKKIDLTDNWLSVNACFHLNKLLTDNNILTHLNLSGCRFGSLGAKKLQESIGAMHTLQYLNVSRCDLGNDGFKYISIGVYCSSSIQIVDFSRNDLRENTANDFQTMLIQTDTLQTLNLSWNNLYSEEFWKKFIIGLIRNSSLTDLNLSWNSLGTDCLPFLQEYLTKITNLLKLNLKNNRIGPNEVAQISQSLIKNKTLEILDLGYNPLMLEGVFILIDSLRNISTDSKLQLINLENIWANKETSVLIAKLKEKLPNLDIKLEGIYSNYTLVGPDPRKIFLKRANFEAMKPKNVSRKRDFGQFIILLQDIIVKKEDFRKAIKKYKLQLSKSLVEEIMNVFEIGDDDIDQKILKEFYLKEYPDTKITSTEDHKKVHRIRKRKKTKNKD